MMTLTVLVVLSVVQTTAKRILHLPEVTGMHLRIVVLVILDINIITSYIILATVLLCLTIFQYLD